MHVPDVCREDTDVSRLGRRDTRSGGKGVVSGVKVTTLAGFATHSVLANRRIQMVLRWGKISMPISGVMEIDR
jgi:hypothetical protein